jgi:hypothetical protein
VSYLDTPRLCFSGGFQVDVSTINNTVGYFDNDAFKPSYQTPEGGGGWNPDGTGFFRLVDCMITGATIDDRWIVDPKSDPVVGMLLENADDRVFGKLVDLDPQQQLCSEIWGLRLRLTGGGATPLFVGDFRPAAFFNLWRRQQTGLPSDQLLGAAYRSVLSDVVWKEGPDSAVLARLREVSDDGCVSIAMSLFGYGRDPSNPRYTLGKLVGSIGPYHRNEPKHFVTGRQMAPSNDASTPNYVDWFVCKVHEQEKTVTADFGNCLQIIDSGGILANFGPVYLGVLHEETDSLLTDVKPQDVLIVGPVDYQTPGWYVTTSGIQTFSYASNPAVAAVIADRPLVLLQPSRNEYEVLAQETLGGLSLRADSFVLRLEPNQTKSVDLYASRYGKPLSAASIQCADTPGLLGATGTPGPPDVPTPEVMTPSGVLTYAASVTTDANGMAVLEIKAGPMQPPQPRGYIDGQLYGVGYTLAGQPKNTVVDGFNFISALVFGPVDVPEKPTWNADVLPILQQYANLYPIMSKRLLRLDDYETVVQNLRILQFAFSLPIADPNHMPVTRDLSDGRRAVILKWMAEAGPDGLPLKGEGETPKPVPAPLAVMAPVALYLKPIQRQGKTAVLLELAARGMIRRSL